MLRRLVAALRAARTRTVETRDKIIAAKSRSDAGLLAFQQATNGSIDSRPAEAIANLQRAKTHLDEAQRLVANSDAAVDNYINAILGGASAATAQPSAVIPASKPSRFKPMRTDPAKADEIRPHVGKDRAVATLWDADGNRVLGLHSADDDGPAATAAWKPPWRDYVRLRRHVEAHAAARMHQDGHKTMVMYINLPPCKYFDGCKLNLEDILPKGSTLWMHRVFQNGGTKIYQFNGTGRAYV